MFLGNCHLELSPVAQFLVVTGPEPRRSPSEATEKMKIYHNATVFRKDNRQAETDPGVPSRQRHTFPGGLSVLFAAFSGAGRGSGPLFEGKLRYDFLSLERPFA
jgi:hypothetical protein